MNSLSFKEEENEEEEIELTIDNIESEISYDINRLIEELHKAILEGKKWKDKIEEKINKISNKY